MSQYKFRYAAVCLMSGVILVLSSCRPTVVVSDNHPHGRHYHHHPHPHHGHMVKEEIIVR